MKAPVTSNTFTKQNILDMKIPEELKQEMLNVISVKPLPSVKKPRKLPANYISSADKKNLGEDAQRQIEEHLKTLPVQNESSSDVNLTFDNNTKKIDKYFLLQL